MIFTVTLNPCIDYYIQVELPLQINEVNRGTHESSRAAGKGLNVSKILSSMDIPTTAIAVLGGFTGHFIEDQLSGNGLLHLDPVNVSGDNRVNVKAWCDEKHSININGEGPTADNITRSIVLSRLHRTMPNDWVLFCGSMMKGFDEAFLIEACETVHAHGGIVVIDMEQISQETLLACKADLIKPNLYELNILLKRQDITWETLPQAVEEARKYSKQVLVSAGKYGAMLITQTDTYRMHQPQTNLVNKSGAGDAMLGVYVATLSRQSGGVENALKWAGAAGNAVASTLGTVDRKLVESFLDSITVERVSNPHE